MATADLPTTDTTNLEELIPLLQEFTGKLRELSDQIMLSITHNTSSRFSRLLVMDGVIGGCIAMLVWVFLQPSAWWTPVNSLSIFVSVAATISSVVALRQWTTVQQRFVARLGGHRILSVQELSIRVRDFQILTDQVGRLIRRASQLNEQFTQEFNRRIELDLRLTEAEIVLNYAHKSVLPTLERMTVASTTIE